MVSSLDVTSWSNEQQLTSHEVFEFETHVHVRKNGRGSTVGLRRATVDRMRVVEDQIRTLQSTSGVALGAIAR